MKHVVGGMKAPPSMAERKSKSPVTQSNPLVGGQKAPPSMAMRKSKVHSGQGKSAPTSAPPRNSPQAKGKGGTGKGKSWPS